MKARSLSPIFAAILLIVVCSLAGCSSRRGQSDDVVIGGLPDQKAAPSTADKMLRMQEKERARQEKDLQDIKRQEYLDEQYRRYLKQH